MKRTLIVATTSYAGMGPYVSEIVNNFSPDDDVFYFFHDYDDDFFKENIKKELNSRSFYYKEANSIGNKLFGLLFNSNKYDRLIIKYCREKDIQVVHYMNGTPTVKMQKQLAKLGLSVLITVHDLEPHEMNKAWYKQFRQHIIYKRQFENLAIAKSFLTNSLDQYDNLKKRFQKSKIAYHAFPSLVTNLIKQGEDIPTEMKSVSKPYILFFGRIEEYKGINILCKAFCSEKSISKHFNLVIAGSGDLSIERDPNDENIVIINRYIKESEISYLYKNAKCVVYPYISVTQSGVLSLSFYYRVPTIASDIPFFKRIIEKTNTGLLFKSGDIQDLTKKIVKILSMDCTDMKCCQQEYYQLNYDGTVIRDSLLTIYSNQ